MKSWLRVERLAILLLGAAVAYLLISQILARSEANLQAGQKAAAQQQAAQNALDAKAVADPLAALCRTDPSVAARVGDACQKAAEVQQEPRVVGPTRAEIAAAVAEYFRENPPPAGMSPTLDQITAVIAKYLTEHGRAPTAEEVRAYVAAYLSENPPAAGQNGRDGANGRDGRDAPPVTDAEIDASVKRYFAANPVRGVASVTTNSAGHLIVTYTDGSTFDAGQLPPGPQGKQGDQGKTGPPPASWTWQDGLGRTQSCTRTGGSDEQPQYACTASPLLTTKKPG